MTTTIPRSSAIALAAAALAAPRRAWAQTSSPALRIGTSAASTQAEAYYAEQFGYFKQAGIATTQTIVTRSTDTLSAIIRGDLDIGLTSPQAIANAIIHGFPIQVIATAAVFAGNPPPSRLFVLKSSPLGDDPHAYEKATVAVQTLGDSQSLGVLAWLQQHRIGTSKIKFIEMPFPTMGAALERGEVDAAEIIEPFASTHKDTIRAIPHVYESLGPNFAMVAWYGMSDWIAKNPALIKQYVAVMYATAKRVNADPSSVDDLLAAFSKVPVEMVRALPKPTFALATERAQYEPQLQAAADFKFISRFVSYKELTRTS